MKKNIVKGFMALSLIVGLGSCKNNNGHETSAEDAKEAAEATAESMEYTVDTTASTISWIGEKPTGQHTGTIQVSDGTFMANDSIIESGNFTIDMTSIEVTDLEGDDKKSLEAHLMGTVEGKEGDFFNVNEYSDASFEVTGISETEGKMMLEGNLTIKEETKNIFFPVSINKTDNGYEISSEEFKIDRTNWNVNYGSKSVFDGLGDNFIYDDITLKLDIKANKKA
ncbi:YceI family protein [Zunongwangia endophytica]|uniref:YceI family protein n=1 Tax=Zunongwangia endophytica TaxID=1808945 RepID=A0ABV8HDW0_9FLAO|nr:YceI family protein [Zunongwangia endophytica]MDN3593353.1 YceI family protein [Zunongwangia endophytica]